MDRQKMKKLITQKWSDDNIKLHAYYDRHYSGVYNLSLYFYFTFKEIKMEVGCLSFRDRPNEPTQEMWDKLERENLHNAFNKMKQIEKLYEGLETHKDSYYIGSIKK